MNPGDFEREVDVVVVGVGAAGCAAAISAHDEGAEVLVLEKCPPHTAGGNTRFSGGSWFDNRDAILAETYLGGLCGASQIPDALAATWARETAGNSSWIAALGGEVETIGDFGPDFPNLAGSECYGGYRGVRNGLAGGFHRFLLGVVHERRIEVRYAAPAKHLVMADGAVLGVAASADERPYRVRAHGGVVIACGGFENNSGMVREHLGLTDCPIWGSPANTGDGHEMARSAGADLWHMEARSAYVGIAHDDSETGFAVFPPDNGFIWVNSDGRRFVDEIPEFGGHGQAWLDDGLVWHPEAPSFVIFGERTRLAGPICPAPESMPVGWQSMSEGYRWSVDNGREIDRGWIQGADTVADLAGQLGIDPGGLTATIESWNTACRIGIDSEMHRRTETLVPLDEGPYYGFRSAPMLGWTGGGPRRDESSRVINTAGTPIPGLFAAGAVSPTYSFAQSGGFFIADALAFGRIAGRAAARRTETDRGSEGIGRPSSGDHTFKEEP